MPITKAITCTFVIAFFYWFGDIMNNAYSADKAFWHGEHVSAFRKGRFVAPVHMQLVLTNKCNHNCVYCAYRNKDYFAKHFNQTDQLNSRKAYEIIRCFDACGGKAVQFTGGGEPLMHPHANEIIKFAQLNGLKTALVSNGEFLNDIEPSVVENLNWIRISLDSGSEEMFAKYRKARNGTFLKVMDNINNLKTCKGVVGLGFVVNNINYTDIVNFSSLVKEFKIDNVRFSAVFTEKRDAHFTKEMRDEINNSLEIATTLLNSKNIKVYNNFNDRYSDLCQRPKVENCNYMRFTTYVGADANLYSCCVYSYNDQGFLASLEDTSLSCVYAEDTIQKKIMNFDVSKCELCMFNNKNEKIEAYINKNNIPQDVDFV